MLRGLVGRMGFAGAHGGVNGGASASPAPTSPMSSYPGTPVPPAHGASVDALAHFSPLYGGDAGSRSPTHSPTASLSLGRESGGVFAAGGLLGKKKPKRKLVISGVAPDDVRAFEAVKSWCEVR